MYEGNENFSVEFSVSRVKHRKWQKLRLAVEVSHLKRARFLWERKSKVEGLLSEIN